MATLNLGRIKPVFRGAYNNSTAYVVDDIVTSGGSSYICIQASTGNAVSNSTYWTLMAQGGTDVGTTLTTQGDILYRDGSGLQRLGAGTSGQLLQSGGSGANVSWTNAPVGISHVSMWWCNTAFDGNASPITSNLASQIYFGSADMSVSSGVFTFPVTGYWLVQFQTAHYENGDDSQIESKIVRSTDGGSNWSNISVFDSFVRHTSANNTHTSGFGQAIFDVTSTSNVKARFDITKQNSGTTTYAGGGRVSMTFIRLGDT
ncbi:hypothetical protein HTVC041P_gp41 [Pelagibacter phage HTVC041P]|uniref:Tail fiber protein n=1 Tax=Pelagibacter phage HTVC041P TaxID=3072833 RepID=A0AAX4G470_9CAUD|nr:hypothetical protein HTVC041P_gp41 [Pelagibacter phage HTVC041P]